MASAVGMELGTPRWAHPQPLAALNSLCADMQRSASSISAGTVPGPLPPANVPLLGVSPVTRVTAQLWHSSQRLSVHRKPGKQPSLWQSGLPPACQELSSHFHSPDPHQRRLNIELFFAA